MMLQKPIDDEGAPGGYGTPALPKPGQSSTPPPVAPAAPPAPPQAPAPNAANTPAPKTDGEKQYDQFGYEIKGAPGAPESKGEKPGDQGTPPPAEKIADRRMGPPPADKKMTPGSNGADGRGDGFANGGARVAPQARWKQCDNPGSRRQLQRTRDAGYASCVDFRWQEKEKGGISH